VPDIAALIALGVPEAAAPLLLAGGVFFENAGGVPWSDYDSFDEDNPLAKQRSEFFFTGLASFAVAHLLKKYEHKNDWRLKCDVTFLFHLKPLAQSMAAIDSLCRARCYADAIVVARALHSRVHQLALFALGPHLFDEWLKYPKHEKFLDGHMRSELANHGIHIYPHLYDQFSEVIHGQFQALQESGLFEQGLFPRVSAVENAAYVAAKFMLGVAGWVGLAAFRLDMNGTAPSDEIGAAGALFDWLRATVLVPSRMDHLWTMIAEERHWEKVSKKTTAVAKWFDFEDFEKQMALFHRVSSPKRLGKKYRERPTS
jgi:hypothetical protein